MVTRLARDPVKTGRIGGRVRRWWLHAQPPVSGPIRAVYYLVTLICLLFFTLDKDTPLKLPERASHLPSVLYIPRGIIRVLGLSYHPDFISTVRGVTVVAWVAAAAGLCWRASAILTALGWLTLYGFNFAYELSHPAMLPAYVLVIFALFASFDDKWTLDSYIAKRWPGYWFKPRGPESITRTGLPHTLLTVACVHPLFSAGVAKMFDAGPRWMSGATIEYMLHRTGATRLPFLRDFLFAHPHVFPLLGSFTLAVELGAPLALLSRTTRHAFAICGALLHVGIYVLMLPNYLTYSFTYLVLLIDWDDVTRRLKHAPPAALPDNVPRTTWPSVLGFTAIGGMLVVALFQIEFWPVAHMTMFSSYMSNDRIGDVPRAKWQDPEVVHEVATECARGVNGPWLGYCKFGYNVTMSAYSGVRLAGGSSCKMPIDWEEELSPGAPGSHIAWTTALAIAVIHDIAGKPAGKLEELPGQDDILNKFLREIAPLVAAKATQNPACTRLEATYRLGPGPVVLASIPLSPPPTPGPSNWYASAR